MAAAADDPEGVRALWRADPLRAVPLATGRTFDALTVDLRTGMEAIDLLRRRTGAPQGAWRPRRAAGLPIAPPDAAFAPYLDVAGQSIDVAAGGGAGELVAAHARAVADHGRTRRGPLRAHPAGPSVDAARSRPLPEGAHGDRRGPHGAFGCPDGRGWGAAGRARTVRPFLFPALVDGAGDRLRLLVPRGAARRLGIPLTAHGVEYHGVGGRIVLPGPGLANGTDGGAGDGPAWAVRPGAPVERSRCLLGPLAGALATARLTVGWCADARPESDTYPELG
ncbi:hypothetical protein [Streptomyces sp. NPDC057676]|uniref:hypothetical protein n=1 Tax=Streptomyces sp. NPDC057676 TaxID=3346205 RepID=UPI00367EA349